MFIGSINKKLLIHKVSLFSANFLRIHLNVFCFELTVFTRSEEPKSEKAWKQRKAVLCQPSSALKIARTRHLLKSDHIITQ